MDYIGIGLMQPKWDVKRTRILRYQQEVWHKGLNEYKVLSASDDYILANKVRVQIEKWTDKWEADCEKKRISDMKLANIDEAHSKTKVAELSLYEVENILLDSLEMNSVVEWDKLKTSDRFELSFPVKLASPDYAFAPNMPDKNAREFRPKMKLLSYIFKSIKIKSVEKAEHVYMTKYDEWENECKQIAEWTTKRDAFYASQKAHNSNIDEQESKYNALDPSVITEYCEIVLENSKLPDLIQKGYDLEYNPDNKILIIDYQLPNIEDYPNVKEVKYIVSKNELREIYQSNAFLEKLFDTTIYRLILRVVYEEFEADVVDAIDAISFNGWLSFLSKSTGNRENACIASIQIDKASFKLIDLNNVDPKACFKSLNGVGSSKLANVAPIQPILAISKKDKRFVDSYDVESTLDDSTNIAAISWEDFEHLIRELFEHEFSINGGEVKVTQTSRDGGVDAIAFDPDPIRGGKIVIQAKRYTNTVGVSAVRDLYGTVVNEGATKGILVTTANYGSDAYKFAKNKPLTLLNGSNLLYLLEKHGHKAKIDLVEAKLLNQQSELLKKRESTQ